MSRPHLLLLGGTTEGRRLAAALAGDPHAPDVTTSLAGAVAAPAALPGRVRVGGFGGAAGLADWLIRHEVTAVIDATHPFAAQMTANAHAACAAADVPLLRYERPAWQALPGDDWRHVPTVARAAPLADDLGDRLLVTTGRGEAAAFAHVRAWCLLRSIDAPAPPLPRRHEILLDRGPFTLEGERELLASARIEVLVTKNSGGAATAPKLVAAREAGLPVVMVDRAPLPPGLPVATSMREALAWATTGASAGRAPAYRSNTSNTMP